MLWLKVNFNSYYSLLFQEFLASDDLMKFGSLFSGIGGLDLGLERAGMSCRWQIEIDDYARQVLAKHWPDVPRYSDITEVDGRVLEPVDLIAAGFPCQDISYAGRGAGLDGERSGLFWETVRMVQQCQPRYVLLENVAALLTRGLDRVLGTLAEIGYDAEWHCIPAASVGAPHIRDRVFVFAYTQHGGICERSRAEGGEQQRQSPIISRSGCNGGDGNVADARLELWYEGRDSQERTETERCEQAGNTQRYGEDVADTDGTGPQGRDGEELPERAGQCVIGSSDSLTGFREQCTQWLIEPDVGRVAHGVPKRVDRLRGLGNAVVPQVAEWIGKQILQHDEGGGCGDDAKTSQLTSNPLCRTMQIMKGHTS
jgi:DNA (cytosine-5)-methyltransferase 1